MTTKPNIALVYGGASPEHDVSIASATECARAMETGGGFNPLPVYVTREGRWRWLRTDDAAEFACARAVRAAADAPVSGEETGFARALARLSDSDIAAVMIMIHGAGGEDGRLQSALELAGIPFTGSGAAASALAIDKARCQTWFARRGLPVSEFQILRGPEIRDPARVAGVIGGIGIPCVVKPAECGSSVGVTIVREESALEGALAAAARHSAFILVEKFLAGREFTCGVLDRAETGTGAGARSVPRPLPVTEIIPPADRFFDYEAKYTPGLTREVTPAGIDADLTARIQSLALRAHTEAGCRGFSRTDFIVTADGPRILEINTIPGMTGTSLLPQAAAAEGIAMPALVEAIIGSALRP